MGCSPSICAAGKRKNNLNILEVAIFVPSMCVPLQTDLQRALRGGSTVTELQRALEDYLPLLLGLTNKEPGLQEVVAFKWKYSEDGLEVCVANSWFELLSVIHMMAMLTLTEANSMLISENQSDCMRDAVDLLLKASGYLEFCVRDVLVRLPTDIKKQLPKDLQEGILEAISIQALGQGTEIQLGLAVNSQNVSLPVKRRLACEQLSYYGQAHYCLSGCNTDSRHGKKHLLFIKWKYLEAKAAAYYYHGQIIDKGTEPSCHVSAVHCFLAAEDLLSESKKACLTFCLTAPVTRIPPLWGAMKHLNKRIPDVASKKSQMYGFLLEQEKGLEILPDLPEFELSLRSDDFELPEMDSAWGRQKWEIPSQPLKEHLKDSEDEM
ncbi:hypothetical protein RHMOL_Rhmol10G0003500 [Rhododendron molle]|uniref:Uncharacterized protein n=1 Tax=Rhododendron molle TaxID=49168 RepID=A0ACC0LYG6_RHOML|nr:hypothetical protein RHMOL_Rhmol10G0003500 [Rhododendron molle]